MTSKGEPDNIDTNDSNNTGSHLYTSDFKRRATLDRKNSSAIQPIQKECQQINHRHLKLKNDLIYGEHKKETKKPKCSEIARKDIV